MKCIFQTEHCILRVFFSGVTGDFFADVVVDGELHPYGEEQRVLETLSHREERDATWRGTIWIGMACQGRGNGRHSRHQEDCDRGNAIDRTLRMGRIVGRQNGEGRAVCYAHGGVITTVCSRRI